MSKNNDSQSSQYKVVGILVVVLVILLIAFFVAQSMGVFPNSEDMTATQNADASATAAVQTANAPTVTNMPSETATATATETATQTPTATATSTASATNSPEPSETSSPTASSTNTAEPSPTVSELTAATPDPTQIVIADGRISFTIDSFVFLRELEDYQFINGGGLVMFGTIENRGGRRSCMYGTDMKLILDGQEYAAVDALMARVQAELNLPPRYFTSAGGNCLDRGNSAASIIAFDVPLSAQTIAFRYKALDIPLNISWDALVSMESQTSVEALYAASTPQDAEATEDSAATATSQP